MFDELNNIKIDDVAYVLIDESGEKVYANSLENEYDALLTANHLFIVLRKMQYPFKRCQLAFENIHIVVYSFQECYLFFFKDKLIDASVLRKCDVIADKVISIMDS